MRFYARILPRRAAFLRKRNGTALCDAAICYFSQQIQRITPNFVHFLHCFAAVIEKNKYHGKLEVRQLGGGVPLKMNCGGIIMFEKIRNLKNKKGFTLVELIVVLVILAILAALLIPALTGYIDKANKEKVIVEARMVVMAAQTEASSLYGKAGAGKNLSTATDGSLNAAAAEAIKLAEMSGKEVGATAALTNEGKVEKAIYTNSLYTVVYENGSYNVYDVNGADADKKAALNAFTLTAGSATGKATIDPTT